MEIIREQLNRPLVVGVASFIVGLLIGWLAIGWGVWPVRYVNASPEHLHDRAKEEYLRMAIEAFGQNGDVAKAQQRYAALGENAELILQKVIDQPKGQSIELIQTFAALVGYQAVSITGEAPAVTQTPETVAPKQEEKSFLVRFWPAFCVVGIIFLAAVAFFVIQRLRQSQRSFSTTGEVVEPEMDVKTWEPEFEGFREETSLGRFMASYKLGDDFFDDTFSIDSPSGEFLGECGVTISETIGFGEPKKVTAFEVWLFDKNDIQTVTKVFMSAHAYNLEELRQKLMIKGEPLLAKPGVETTLETESLRMTARVMDMSYGDQGMPEQSFFDQFVLELTVYYK